MKDIKISVITTTYNRKNTIIRVFNSLQKQSYKNFEWIIIDDGSNDGTGKLINEFKEKAKFPITYLWQENQGKHVAMNKALNMCKGEYFTSIDSDDEIKSESFEILIKAWNEIPAKDRIKYKSVTARCYNPQTGETIGKPMKNEVIDCSSLDAKYKYKMNYEKWGLSKTSIERDFISPEIKGHFYPEAIIQDLQARKYIERYIDIPLRGYYFDTSNAITKNKIKKENLYLWEHNINDNMDYFFYDIPTFIKSFIGVSMCGYANGLNFKQILKQIKGNLKKITVTLFLPVGYILYKYNKSKYN